MPIDASIVNGLRPIQINDPLQQAGNVLALQGGMQRNALAGLQMQQLQRQVADDEAVRNILKNPEVGGDYTKAANALLSNGQYKAGMAMQKAALEQRGTQAKISKDEADTSLKHLSVLGGVLSPLATKPDVTTDDLVTALQVAADAGVPKTTLQNMIQHIPQNSQLLPQYVQRLAMMTDHGLKSVQAMMPKVDYKDAGGTLTPVNTNPLAGPVGPLAGGLGITKTATPGVLSFAS